MGLSVGEAIESLGRRANAPNMRIFVRSLTQGEKLGVSIGTTMRNLASEMRKRRKAMVEEAAQKIPIKMRFPLDVVFLDADQVVLRVEPGVRSWRTVSCRGAREIVEMAAGECRRRGLEVGDRVAWASRSSVDAPADRASSPWGEETE